MTQLCSHSVLGIYVRGLQPWKLFNILSSSCYYVPPSPRPKATTIGRTLPSGVLSGRRGVEQKGSNKRYLLPNSKSVGNIITSSGVQRRLEMNRGMYMGKGRGVRIGDTAEKLGNMTIGARSKQQQMIKGGNGTHMFTGRSQGYSSKVAG
ncbi:hypothetical protein L6452_17732 [Arctium lappa]|uniref:Uncharacterized protein n=1 Tax=Arctium lappa TaxID=4217 RepID=A0ACB9C4D1_ARCLA|nr:hypothetical protein L6452_17732 [Arctium lappa]